MRTLTRLDRLFRAIVSLTVTGVAVCACSSGVTKTGIDTDVCTSGTLRKLDGIEPLVPVDYMEVRHWTAIDGPPVKGQESFVVSETRGTKCAGAANAAKCKTALDGVENPKTGLRGVESDVGTVTTIAFTRRDEVGSVKNEAELRAFLSMRSVKDAALLAWARGYDIPCKDGDNAGTTADGFLIIGRTGNLCGGNVDEHRLHVMRTGEIFVEETSRYEDGDSTCAIGRRPEGLVPATHARDVPVFAAWLSAIAHLEAASVPAFERLEAELTGLGAPTDLVTRARESAADERRHAEVTAALATAHGGALASVEIAEVRERTLLDVATENATEGCVRETFGALVARYQAEHAADPSVRAAMIKIADDEARHAALAWDIDAWARAALPERAREEIDTAQRAAIAALGESLRAPPPRDAIDLAGMPDAPVARAMFDALASEIWAA